MLARGFPGGFFAIAGVTTIIIAPFTRILMLNMNNELFFWLEAQPARVELSRVRESVVRWTWLYLIWSLLPIVGMIMAQMGTFQKADMCSCT